VSQNSTDLAQIQAVTAAREQYPRPVTRGYLLQDDGARDRAIGVVDWYAYTIPAGDTLPSLVAAEMLEWLPPVTSTLERGMMGYTHGVVLPGEGRVLWNDERRDMGVHVELPSLALRLLQVDAAQLCGWVALRRGKATRVDVAMDTDAVPMAAVVASQERGDLISRAQHRQLIYNYRDGSQTLYVGAPSSDRRVRFYDKALEQASKGVEVNGIWTRCEVQFRHSQADVVSQFIGLGVGLVDVVSSCIDFRDSSADVNVSRCPRLPWWDVWVGKAERVSFAVGSVVADVVARAYNWVQSQVAPTLAFLREALGVGAVDALMDVAVDRIPKYRLQVLEMA
jgi:hypothetical protein